MGDSFVASVQYGDMKGTVAIGGHETGGPLEGDLIAHVKPGFLPVGFGLSRLDTDANGNLPHLLYTPSMQNKSAEPQRNSIPMRKSMASCQSWASTERFMRPGLVHSLSGSVFVLKVEASNWGRKTLT